MRATISNMRKYYPRFGTNLIILDDNGEDVYSANPYDYWALPDDEDLKGTLVVKATMYFPVEDYEDEDKESA